MNEEWTAVRPQLTTHHPACARRALMALSIGALLLPVPVAAAKMVVGPQRPAPSTYVRDLSTDEVRVNERAELVRPIASLTKLMTAMVLLDARANLGRTVSYNPARHAAYRNWMRFARGDRLRGRDLLLAMLAGSQNIPARMLVDLTPYSEGVFVQRMNAKAAALGLVQTRFVDVHGLSPKNVSTAAEVTRMFDAALTYPDIRDALGRAEVQMVWQTRRGRKREHLFHHTNPLLARRQRFATEASKTGYLDEAGDAIAMRIRDEHTGHRYLIVTLGEPRQRPRFSIAKRLADAAVSASRISSVSE